MAASAAMTRPAPRSHSVAVIQPELPVLQNTRSHRKVATKNAIGNGMSIGWIGCPAMLAVLFGLRRVIAIARGPQPFAKRRDCSIKAGSAKREHWRRREVPIFEGCVAKYLC